MLLSAIHLTAIYHRLSLIPTFAFSFPLFSWLWWPFLSLFFFISRKSMARKLTLPIQENLLNSVLSCSLWRRSLKFYGARGGKCPRLVRPLWWVFSFIRRLCLFCFRSKLVWLPFLVMSLPAVASINYWRIKNTKNNETFKNKGVKFLILLCFLGSIFKLLKIH